MRIDRSHRAAIETAAEKLRLAIKTGRPCAPLRHDLPGNDVDAAYAVQDSNTQIWLREGRRPVGRKIGLTAKAVQRQLGVDRPDYGMLFADMVVMDGEEIASSRVLQPRLEAEVAFVMGQSLNAERISIVDVIRATEYVLPAIEVVGSRIENWDINIVDTIADNASSGLFVLGTTPKLLNSIDLELSGMTLARRGEILSLGTGAACLGNPLNAVAWLARIMRERGRPLTEGDIVLSGALGPMVPASSGDAFEARIGGIGAVRALFASSA